MTPTPNQQAEREAFEAWYESDACLGVEPTWAAWQARAALSAAPTPQPAAEPVAVGVLTFSDGEPVDYETLPGVRLPDGDHTLYATPPAKPQPSDAERWRFAMDRDNKQFAVCINIDGEGWEPLKNDGPIDAALAAAKEREHG